MLKIKHMLAAALKQKNIRLHLLALGEGRGLAALQQVVTATGGQFVRQDELGGLINAVFGSSRKLVEMARVAGGSKKGVYRLTLDDGCTSILYVWSESESYWPASEAEPCDPFADASGVDLFVAGHTRLDAVGVRTPSVYVVDASHRDYPADFAVVEDVRGGTLEDLIGRSPAAPCSWTLRVARRASTTSTCSRMPAAAGWGRR